MNEGTCSVDGCPLPAKATRLCDAHYRQKRKGKPFTPVRRSWLGKVMERDADGNKECRDCRNWLPEREFVRNSKAKDGLHHRCRACNRDASLQRRYGITSARYDALLAAQNGGCAICGRACSTGRMLAVDHDHACCPGATSCGRCVRGLLCNSCNHAIGKFEDSPAWLRAAANYVEHGRLAVAHTT